MYTNQIFALTYQKSLLFLRSPSVNLLNHWPVTEGPVGGSTLGRVGLLGFWPTSDPYCCGQGSWPLCVKVFNPQTEAKPILPTLSLSSCEIMLEKTLKICVINSPQKEGMFICKMQVTLTSGPNRLTLLVTSSSYTSKRQDMPTRAGVAFLQFLVFYWPECIRHSPCWLGQHWPYVMVASHRTKFITWESSSEFWLSS